MTTTARKIGICRHPERDITILWKLQNGNFWFTRDEDPRPEDIGWSFETGKQWLLEPYTWMGIKAWDAPLYVTLDPDCDEDSRVKITMLKLLVGTGK